MLNQKKIFCVIPAFNEEKTVVEIINSVKPMVDEVVVVDDCSSDSTYKLAVEQNITVLRHIINRDQGAALETGNQYALKHGAYIIVHFDADGQFAAEEIKDLLEPIIKEEADAVFGSRFLEKKSQMPKLKKNIIMPLARLVNLVFFNIRLTDPQSGFRAMSAKVAKRIKIDNDGRAHCSEILHKAFKNNFRVKEVPITVVYNDFGLTFSSGVKIIKDLVLGKLVK